MLSRLERDPVADAGMTLIELVVGMTLMVIVSAVALNFFLGTTKQANLVTEQTLVGATARTAMTQIVKTLQVADTPGANSGYSSGRFVTMSPNEVTFYSNIATTGRSGTALRGAPTEIDFTLTNGTLWESTYAPKSTTTPATYPTTPTSRNALVTGITNYTTTPATPVFTFCSDATDPATTCTATTDPTAVALVQVSLTVQGLKGTTPQTVQSSIAIAGEVS